VYFELTDVVYVSLKGTLSNLTPTDVLFLHEVTELLRGSSITGKPRALVVILSCPDGCSFSQLEVNAM